MPCNETKLRVSTIILRNGGRSFTGNDSFSCEKNMLSSSFQENLKQYAGKGNEHNAALKRGSKCRSTLVVKATRTWLAIESVITS